MFTNTPKTNMPTQYSAGQQYSTTFTGPIYKDRRLQDQARNDSLARAAYSGTQRQYNQQFGPGVRAGSAMANYRSGIQADSEASKAYAQAQQDMLNRTSDKSASDMQFQERLSGERGWMRDLMLDNDNTVNKERMAAMKRFADLNLGDFERKTKEAVAAEARKTEILGGLL